ncbi:MULTISPECIES: MotA/TolQ/ExbB proton channel family protein [Limnobacter]|uniref:Biopolymer transporter n=1 Tax=Limnobacter litoralis TaxID=481366 RepID=A0ABQ5YQA6_9BURK|nr:MULTISPECIES: MotA/TolQ/ExbB proton channel family protein [Limnobacter]GLR25975.1 biopolymer transporter [Limnobacter litoralis]
MWAIITAAGWPIWPLIFASMAALAIVFERVWYLRSAQIAPKGLIQDVVKNLTPFKDPQNLARLHGHSLLGSVAADGLGAALSGQDPEQAMLEKAEEVQDKLEKHLDVLSMIASAAPMMGLLGTVIGMIEIFATQGQTAQNPEVLAAGISVALYNTAFGLIVAIPALVAYRLFKIRINALMNHMGLELKPLEAALRQQLKTASTRAGRG